jgi:hypothetical protein
MIDPQYPQRVLQEVFRTERGLGEVRRIAGWLATVAGIIPVPGLGLAATLLTEGIGAQIERKRQSPWRWFYLISDGRGAT